MKTPISWLKDFVDIDVDLKTFVHKMTMSGSKVETIEVMGAEITNVVIGKIVEITQHPDADKLQVTQVDVGEEEIIQIVTGAQNVFAGAIVPVALSGSTLPRGVNIKKGKLRGVESNGMLCSIAELNLTLDDCPGASEDGIYILPEVTEDGIKLEPGMDAKEALKLNETVIEFEITPNRPDCLSVYGIAGEAAVTLGAARRNINPVVQGKGTGYTKDFVSVNIEATDLCTRYIARVVTDVTIAPSPKWMRDRLKAAGVRAINNIVDITNYVMLELGQPLHAFDIREVHGKQINVRRANANERFATLDEIERTLDNEMLVIADGERPVALAGIMGGQNSEIKPDTTTVLFESANFLGSGVRATSKRLGLRTESSSRFEKGLDPENALTAINRACELVERLGCGKVAPDLVDNYASKPSECRVKFRPDAINALLGTEISSHQMQLFLSALGFTLSSDGSEYLVPSHRADVSREADLAEEIARLYDYNNIRPTLLDGKQATMGKKTFKQRLEDEIVDTLNACGLSEIYTYSFGSPKAFDLLKTPLDSLLRNAVVISNPLGEDYSLMRTTTIGDMLTVLARNFNQRTEGVRLFELSKVYLPREGELLPEEKPVLTLGMYGNCDFFDIKGVVEALLTKLGIKAEYSPVTDCETFHPGRTAEIKIGDTVVGVVGEIHPEVSENYSAAKRNYVAVIDVLPLVENAKRMPVFKQLPKYPAMTRDLAVLIDDAILIKEIQTIIDQRGGKTLESATLFDVYKGNQVPEGKKSVAYALVFRATDRTLTDEEVSKTMKKITDGLNFQFGAELRL
ncbi:MAG: phenylalanine--tRNA ligase subunit beta [Bacillota bacterium]